MTELATLLQVLHTLGSGPVTVLVIGGGWLLYRARRDKLVTEARRDERLLPGVLAGAAEERREWFARLERMEAGERECRAQAAALALRLEEVERRCGACANRQ